MRTGTATQHDRLKRLFLRNADRGSEAGVSALRFSGVGDGSTIEIDGRPVANFGNCSYLGLSVDDRLKAGAIEATQRFGPLYSSSQVYTAVDLYTELEELFIQMTAAPAVVLPSTTTLGHLSCLPTVVGEKDAVILDSHSHASLQMTVQVLAARGIPVTAVTHGDAEALSDAVEEASAAHRHVWYLCDGIYSMFGDLAPLDTIAGLMDQHENLYVYYDDAHGFSWKGLHGRGYVLDGTPLHERMVVAVGLAKSFGSGGAALFFGDPDHAHAVRNIGGPMNFSGPIHPPSLGAAVASAHIHLSEEHHELRRQMDAQIGLVSSLLAANNLPVVSWAQSPIWLVRVGEFDHMLELAGRMRADGFYLNPTAFPAVPMGLAGLRFTHTLSNNESQIAEMVDTLTRHFREVVGEPHAVIDLDEMEGAGTWPAPTPRAH